MSAVWCTVDFLELESENTVRAVRMNHNGQETQRATIVNIQMLVITTLNNWNEVKSFFFFCPCCTFVFM